MVGRGGTLSYDVYVAPSIPTAIDDRPPGTSQRMWSPIASTLISGQREAVLIDPLMTADQAGALADWVSRSGKDLTTVYVTHGHGDHWFGLATLLERFPRARALAIPSVLAQMHTQMAPDFFDRFWQKRFPGQLPEQLVAAEAMDGRTIELEGEELVVHELGHTDTDDTTCVHAPSIGLVVAGDAVYNDVHCYLAESPPPKRQDWLRALDVIEALRPDAVVAGHKRESASDTPEAIDLTRQYLQDFERLETSTTTTLELYEAMLALHPDRLNPGALWGSARVSKRV
jgi:glyoxylase-like metal-dependent hydrolase (beta-lactamase superfamily II)